MQGAKDIRLEHLEEMRGVQYLAEDVPGPKPDDPVFVIQKVRREGWIEGGRELVCVWDAGSEGHTFGALGGDAWGAIFSGGSPWAEVGGSHFIIQKVRKEMR